MDRAEYAGPLQMPRRLLMPLQQAVSSRSRALDFGPTIHHVRRRSLMAEPHHVPKGTGAILGHQDKKVHFVEIQTHKGSL